LPWLLDRGSAYGGDAEHYVDGEATLASALAHVTAAIDVKATGINCAFEQIADCLATLAPVVVQLPGAAGALFVVRATRRRVIVITPSGRQARLSMAELSNGLIAEQSSQADRAIAGLTAGLGRGGAAIAAALRRQLGRNRPVFIGWALESERFVARSRELAWRHCLPLLATHLLQFTLWLSSWVALVLVLSGVGEQSRMLVLWGAALLSALALLPVESALEQGLAARIGVAVKRRLLLDALAADKAYVAKLGLGQMIAQSLETHHLDAMAARGSIRSVLAVLDISVVSVAYGAVQGIDGLLLLFLLVAGWSGHCGRVYHRQAKAFLARHLEATSVHVEQLVGHRTRKAFVAADQWNAEEDRSIARYHESGRRIDSAYLRLAAMPRIWTVLALLVVLVTLYRSYGAIAGGDSVAMIGFVIVTFAALQSAVAGASEAIRAWVTFKQLELSERDVAATRNRRSDSSSHAAKGGARGLAHAMSGDFVCRGINYRYPGALQPVLADVDLSIVSEDRVLMTGRSGSGKSTLASVLAGRIQQDGGVVLSGGVDRHIVGMQQWRNLVCYVPQVGANHVLTDTFAFNLLLGRPWPPVAEDLQDALAVLRDLGLDSLLERMPAGMMQMVGDGGWTLSQGEKVRLFIARGLLQRARLLVADEILSPLDAQTALKTLAALERYPGRLMLIAHS
jgi:ATP-binding cassette subfamily B protein